MMIHSGLQPMPGAQQVVQAQQHAQAASAAAAAVAAAGVGVPSAAVQQGVVQTSQVTSI